MFRPEISDTDVSVDQYDEIILGFPIWWYVAPTIINTFLGKIMILRAKRLYCLQPPVEVDLEIQ